MTGEMASPDGLPGIGGHRYEGYSLETKYGWLQQGQGAAAVTEGADFLAELAGDFAESERTIRTVLGRLGVSWQGAAAEQAAAALGAVADWARGGAASSAGGSATIGEYGESFARLRSKVAEPPALTQGSRPATVLDGLLDAVSPDFGAVSGLQTDYRRRLAEYQRLDRAANDALYAHEAQTRAAVRAFPIPDAPPAVATITVATGTLTGQGPIPRHPGAVPPGVPGQRGPDQGADPAADWPAPTQPAPTQPAATQSPGTQSPGAQSPSTVPAAGGVARAGGAVPDPGLLGGGHGAPLGVDPGGVLPGGFPGFPGFPGFAGDPGGRYSDRWTRPAPPGGSGPGDPDDWPRHRPSGNPGGYGGDYGGGLRPRGVPGFAGPGGELPGGLSGAGPAAGGLAGGGSASGGQAGGGLAGPARPSQPGAGQGGVGQGGVGQGGVDFDLPDGGRAADAGRGGGQPGQIGQHSQQSQQGQRGPGGRVGDLGRGDYGRDGARVRHGSGLLPSDEPFAVDCDDVPAVLGLPERDEQRW
ncbi:MAG TPA: hypothetical protein VNP03_28560 [Pseudonocardia sp.]|nr:hypothetical protein [Pseudonocardia sp.]